MSALAELVTLHKGESAIPDCCERPGEVTTGVCANTTPCPGEVMKKIYESKPFSDNSADAVWLYNTMLEGTQAAAYEIACKCNK